MPVFLQGSAAQNVPAYRRCGRRWTGRPNPSRSVCVRFRGELLSGTVHVPWEPAHLEDTPRQVGGSLHENIVTGARKPLPAESMPRSEPPRQSAGLRLTGETVDQMVRPLADVHPEESASLVAQPKPVPWPEGHPSP